MESFLEAIKYFVMGCCALFMVFIVLNADNIRITNRNKGSLIQYIGGKGKDAPCNNDKMCAFNYCKNGRCAREIK